MGKCRLPEIRKVKSPDPAERLRRIMQRKDNTPKKIAGIRYTGACNFYLSENHCFLIFSVFRYSFCSGKEAKIRPLSPK